ncbi:3-dehydroquinate synthase family protein [Streptomyces crystallinus]|uniref:3-dehydroquinate synthase family protein n=1 Tax=Streptomyces crystallinus TaxID=68191 RepID=UPI0031E1B660
MASPAVAIDRSVGSGPAHFPVQIRAGSASWDELTAIARGLDADRFVVVSDQGVPTALTHRVLHHLGAAAPARWVGTSGPDGVGAEEIPSEAVIVALGGTSVLDAVGRAAAHTRRGPLLLPTTLPAALDTALSLVGPTGPRRVPVLVRAQLEFLDTLTPGAVRPGLYALVRNVLSVCPASYDQICARLRPDGRYDRSALASFIALCADARAALTCYDPLEDGPAGVFRYGHTVADALRVLGVGALRYGDAVALGLLVAARCARRTGLLDAAGEAAHRELLARWGAPDVLPAPVTAQDVLGVLRTSATGPGAHDFTAHEFTGEPDRSLGMVLLDTLGQPHVCGGHTVATVGLDTLRAGLEAVAAAEDGLVPRPGGRDRAGTRSGPAPHVPGAPGTAAW